MKIKTYGIYNLTEWHGKVKAGTIEINVSFVGGTSSPSGCQPAYYVTKDPIAQFVIENSKEYKEGFIKIVMCQEIEGTHKRMAIPKGNKKEETTINPILPKKVVEEQPSEESVEVGVADTTEDGKAIIEVTDIDDARDYLCDNFGYARSALRSNVSIKRAADENNIKFKGIE